jgi:NTE family protein
MGHSTPPPSLVLSGGVALGSYQAGVYEALHDRPRQAVGWVAGSSVGAINGALIAGSAPDRRVDTLETYWLKRTAWNAAPFFAATGGMRHAVNWLNVTQARFFGSPGHLQRVGVRMKFTSFYDLAPTVSYLKTAVDFGRLNSGDIRFTVAATDLETGDAVFFDTGKGDRIEMDHILASCGFLPEFAPVEIAGRLMGDGGLAMNAPFEPVLDEVEGTDAAVFLVDLFARDGERPGGLEAAWARKNAILFGNQTWYRLDAYRRLWQRHMPAGSPAPTIFYLSYLPVKEEAGAEMSFDFSHATAQDRWRAGFLDAQDAIARRARGDCPVVTPIRRTQGDAVWSPAHSLPFAVAQ